MQPVTEPSHRRRTTDPPASQRELGPKALELLCLPLCRRAATKALSFVVSPVQPVELVQAQACESRQPDRHTTLYSVLSFTAMDR